MSTRAIQYLKKTAVTFEVVRYDHLEKGAVFAARAIGFDLDKTIKTLVVDLGRGKHALALVPGSGQLVPKRLARALGVKRIHMADTAAAERLTGYMVGGISPFATRQRLPVIMETRLLDEDQVAINAGQRGVMLIMAPGDILQTLAAKPASITG